MNQSRWAQWVDTAFRAELPDGRRAELRLTQVKDKGSNEALEQFSLYFESETFLPQQTYRILHDEMEPQLWLLVPVGEAGGRFVYEAAFSIFHKGGASE